MSEVLFDSGKGPSYVALMNFPSARIALECELTHTDRVPIDFSKLAQQFWGYVHFLVSQGIRVIALRVNPEMADSVFVEDPFKVFHEVAVTFPMGVESRRNEAAAFEQHLRQFRSDVRRIDGEGVNIEGGDVYWIGKDVFVGMRRNGNARTNEAGFQALSQILEPFGYRMHRVYLKDPNGASNGGFRGALHLTTGSSVICRNPGTVLVNTDWVETTEFERVGIRVIQSPSDEPFAANCKILPNGLLVSQWGNPGTLALLSSEGFAHTPLDLTQFRCAEGSPTCCVGGIFRAQETRHR